MTKQKKRSLHHHPASPEAIEILKKEITPVIEQIEQRMEQWEQNQERFAEHIQVDKDIHKAYDVAEIFLNTVKLTIQLYRQKKVKVYKRKKNLRPWRNNDEIVRVWTTLRKNYKAMQSALKDVNIPEFHRATNACRRSINVLLKISKRFTQEGMRPTADSTYGAAPRHKLYDPKKNKDPAKSMEEWKKRYLKDQGIEFISDLEQAFEEEEIENEDIENIDQDEKKLKFEFFLQEDDNIEEIEQEEQKIEQKELTPLEKARLLYRQKKQRKDS